MELIKKRSNDEPTVAPGIDDQEELNAEATSQEKKKGDFTSVTNLSYDEVDES